MMSLHAITAWVLSFNLVSDVPLLQRWECLKSDLSSTTKCGQKHICDNYEFEHT